MTLESIISRLEAAGIEEAKHEAYLLAEHFLKIPRSKLVVLKNEELVYSKELEDAVERRTLREPLQYILGEWYFMDEVYEVTPDVLIPRDDTEVLVGCGIDNLPENGRFADLCTGSGCVAISLLTHRKDATGLAVEKYPETLEVAVRNAEKNGVSDRLEFVLGDVSEDVFREKEMFDCILTNPPYVTLDEYALLGAEERKEPRHALTDEADGLSIIRRILDIYPKHIKENGFIAVEIGSKQGDALRFEAEKRSLDCELLTDIEGRDRVAVLRKTKLQNKEDII